MNYVTATQWQSKVKINNIINRQMRQMLLKTSCTCHSMMEHKLITWSEDGDLTNGNANSARDNAAQ